MSTFDAGLPSATKKKRDSVRAYMIPEMQEKISYSVAAQPDRDSWRASSAGVCERKNVLTLTDPSGSDISYSSAVTMSIGTSVHEAFQNAMLDTDHMIVAEDEMTWKELRVSGHSDGLCIDPMLKIPYIIDFKTCGKLPTKPKFDHVRQMHLYAMLTGFAHENCLELVYISRDFPHAMKAFSVFDTNILDAVIRTILLSNKHYKGGTLPPVPFKNKTNCTYCAYKDKCWEGEIEKGVEILITDSDIENVYKAMQTRKRATLYRMLYSGYNTTATLKIINDRIQEQPTGS